VLLKRSSTVITNSFTFLLTRQRWTVHIRALVTSEPLGWFVSAQISQIIKSSALSSSVTAKAIRSN
jgi:hypothetical protein